MKKSIIFFFYSIFDSFEYCQGKGKGSVEYQGEMMKCINFITQLIPSFFWLDG